MSLAGKYKLRQILVQHLDGNPVKIIAEFFHTSPILLAVRIARLFFSESIA